MDNEQAIKIIKDCKEKSFKRTLYTLNEYYEALDMAIEALEQQPCEDAISREAVKEILAKYHLGESRIAEELNELHSVQRTSNAKKHVENTLEDAISRQEVEKLLSCGCADAIWNLPSVTVQEKPNRSKFEFDEEQEQLDFVQPHKKIKVNLVKFDTPYTDTISRQTAIDAMREETCGCCWDAKDILEHLPSVSTEKTGRWIGHREHCENLGVMPSGLGAYEWCSNCDCGIDVREWHRNNYNYCPNCGAKMEEEREVKE